VTDLRKTRPCTESQGRRALDQADSLRSWSALYVSYKEFRRCDTGAIAEGYSESVARIFVDHWASLPELDRIANTDAEFRSFVLRHLDATDNTDDIVAAKRNAHTRCPQLSQSLCRDLIKQADAALKEATSP
jgi:hypothetical protein